MARGSRQRVGTFLKFVNGEVGSISVGDIIALSKTVDNTAIRAQATDMTRMPAIGIAKKVTAEKVVVQVDSVFSWPDSSSVSITTGKDYWVSSSIGDLICPVFRDTPDILVLYYKAPYLF